MTVRRRKKPEAVHSVSEEMSVIDTVIFLFFWWGGGEKMQVVACGLALAASPLLHRILIVSILSADWPLLVEPHPDVHSSAKLHEQILRLRDSARHFVFTRVMRKTPSGSIFIGYSEQQTPNTTVIHE